MIKSTYLLALINTRYKNHIAIRANHRAWTYEHLLGCIHHTIQCLNALGIPKHAPIALISSNHIRAVIVVLAGFFSGRKLILINPMLSEHLVNEQLEQAGCHVALVDDAQHHMSYIASRVNLREVTQIYPVKVESKATEYLSYFGQSNFVMFTSGSSSKSKMVTISIDKIILAANDSNNISHLSENDRCLLSTPLYHVAGLMQVFRSLLAGACIIIPREKSIQCIMESILNEDVSFFSTVPVMLQKIVSEKDVLDKLVRMKCILVGGQLISESLFELIKGIHFPAFFLYGMTETCSHITFNSLANMDAHNELGRVMPHISFQINDDGELLLRGLRLANIDKHDPKHWYNTHDLVSQDQEGNLCYHGRNDDVLISGGENISTSELTHRLQPLFEKPICVMAAPDEKWGQRPIVFVEGLLPNSNEHEQIKRHIQALLPKFMQPEAVIYMAQFPRTELGKLCKADMLAQFYCSGTQNSINTL